jgi:hypothetical protein
MDDWIEIFRAGKNTDSKGRTRTWTQADLDKMVSSYSPSDYEAPIVIGHPQQDNAPAYGWVKGLKRVGDLLLAKFKQVAPEFSKLVEEGRYKKRSIRVHQNGTLGHVAFLGAVPAAINGLKDIQFSSDIESNDYDYSEEAEFMDVTLKQLEEQLATEKALRATAEKLAADFKAKAEKGAADFSAAQKLAKRTEIVAFVEAGIKEARILPAWKDKGLVEFMTTLEEQDGDYEFSSGKKESAGDWFKTFISDFSSHPLFKEMVKPEQEDKQKNADFAADEKLAEEMVSYVTPAK